MDEADRAGENGRNHAAAKKVRCLTVTPGRAGLIALADLWEPRPAPEMLLVQAIASEFKAKHLAVQEERRTANRFARRNRWSKVTIAGRLTTADIGRLEHVCSTALTSESPNLDTIWVRWRATRLRYGLLRF